jgi:anti-sigma factor RsiW
MTCGSVRRRLSDYLEGDLSERDEARLRTHLDACAECGAELRALQRAVRGLRDLGSVEPPGDLAASVMARLRAGEGRPPRLRLARLFGPSAFSWVAPLAVATGIGAIAWLGGLDAMDGAPGGLRNPLVPPVVAAARVPALRTAGTRPVVHGSAPAGAAASLPSIASCLDRGVPASDAADDCAHWYSWFVAMALEDTRGFLQEVERLPVKAREPWLRRVSEFARRSGSAPLVGQQLRTSRDPRATRIATRFDRGHAVRTVGWSAR